MSAVTLDFSVVSPIRHGVGECPTWDHQSGQLLWTSILDGEIHALTPETGAKHVWRLGPVVGSFGLCRSGKLVVARKSDIVLFDRQTETIEPLAQVTHAVADMRLNDGKVGPDGAFWVSSMDDRAEKEAIACLYRINAQGGVTQITDGVKIGNGLAWDDAGTTMYFADTRGPWVDKWDFDPATGKAANRRRFIDANEKMGRPDGAACDAEGNYWSAAPSASRVNKFLPSGELLSWMPAPNFRPTMPCFGGAGLDTLYVSSLSQGLSAQDMQDHPLAGTLLAAPVKATGLRTHFFADGAA